MLNLKHSEIADFLLKYLYSVGGRSSLDDYPIKLKEQGFDKFEWHIVRQILIKNLKLISYVGNSDYNIILTPEGNKAAKMGIEKYLDQIEQDKQLDREEKKSSIKGVKNAKVLAIIAIIASFLLPISIDIFNKKIYNPSNVDANSDSGIKIGHSDIPSYFTDSLLIEELKNSLKHDTLFLNDIRQLIK